MLPFSTVGEQTANSMQAEKLLVLFQPSLTFWGCSGLNWSISSRQTTLQLLETIFDPLPWKYTISLENL